MSPPGWDPPPDLVTSPVQIEKEALYQIHFLEGERVLRVWKTGRGYLVMTNLRCTEVSRRPQVFGAHDWEAGPNFFFYNLAAPKVEFQKFLRLSEDREERALVVRFLLHDPSTVAQEIEEARHAGQNEWLRRRAQAEASVRESERRWESGRGYASRDGYRQLIRVRCSFCGNLIEVTASRCPFCGAPGK